ncbi:MAG: hypothetical protein MUO57_18695 [Anaerolineales bacterium]|nr:hypothetical protein [Anaerolineales bacterium]
MSNVPGFTARVYHLFLRAYPPNYIETFGNEMYSTFIEGTEETQSQSALISYIIREFREMPKALLKAYWHACKNKILNGIQLLSEATRTSDLAPAPPDGRESWLQAVLELSPFLISGLLLILISYLPFDGMRAGWQRDLGFLGKVIIPLTLPAFIIGMMRGLPRWAYPFGGLFLSYQALVAFQSGQWLFLIVMLFASVILAAATIFTSPQPFLLPVQLQRIGQSLSLDWTRLSYGFYGAMPLLIIMAFDDSHLNNRTPYLALSVLIMVGSALIYCRSRDLTMQIMPLLAGLTLIICGAWLDQVSFAGGLMNWDTSPPPRIGETTWMFLLWIQWVFLILSPVLLISVGRVFNQKHPV